MVNKTTIEDERVARLTWGAAQLGIAQGVLDAVARDVLPPDDADELVLLLAVWIDSAAVDETAVRGAAREATRAAIADAVAPPSRDEVRASVEGREEARSAYYGGS